MVARGREAIMHLIKDVSQSASLGATSIDRDTRLGQGFS